MLPSLTLLNGIGIIAAFLGVWLVGWSFRSGATADIIFGTFWLIVAWVMFSL